MWRRSAWNNCSRQPWRFSTNWNVTSLEVHHFAYKLVRYLMSAQIRFPGDRQCVWKLDLAERKTKNDEGIYNAVNCCEKIVPIDLIFWKNTHQQSFTGNSKMQNYQQKKSFSKHSYLVSLQQNKWSVLSSYNESTILITDVQGEWRFYRELRNALEKSDASIKISILRDSRWIPSE